MTIKALIFDFDGTIIDTERTEISAWQSIYEEHGFELPLSEWLAKNVGTCHNLFDPFKHLSSLVKHSLDEVDIHQRRRKKLFALIEQLAPFPGVLDWIHHAKHAGLRLGMASNSHTNWVVSHLERLELKHYFDVIVTRDDVIQPKPHPEIYQLVMNKLNIKPNEGFAIEDSPAGVTAALAANLECLVVPNTITSQLVFPEVRFKAKTLEHISLAEMLKLMCVHVC